MRVVKAELSQPILLGRQGEHGVTQVVFDLSGYIKTYGDGVAQLTVKRPGDQQEYMGVLTQTGTTAVWEIGPEWTELAGQGYCYLHWHVDDDHAKPVVYKTMVQESQSACDAPEPQVGYLDRVETLGAQAVRAAESAEKSEKDVLAVAKRFEETFSEVVQTAAQTAEDAAGQAMEAAENSGASERMAAEHRGAAEAAALQAGASAEVANRKAGDAAVSAQEACVARDGAIESAVAAEGSAANAEESAANAEEAARKAAEHQTAAEEAAEQATGALRQGNLLYANALKGTVRGEAVRLDDASPLEHTVPVKVSSKNLCPVASTTTKQDHAGRVYLKVKDYPWVANHGRYIFSADVTVYPEDTAGRRWFDLNIYYEDGTYDLGRIGIEDVETLRDGVTRHYSVAKRTNPDKKITQIVLVPLSHDGSSSTARNAKAENIQLELGATATAYTPYVPDLSAVTLRAQGKNLFPTASITTDESKSGGRFFYGMPHGTYTLSADVTKYSDDEATATRVSITVHYTDGTSDVARCAMDSNRAECDGVTRHKSATLTTNLQKEIKRMQCSTLDYSSAGTIRHAKAENILLELGDTDTGYEPYREPVSYTPSADGLCEVVPQHPDMTISAIDLGAAVGAIYPGVVLDCEYNRDINKAFEQLTQAIISMGGNI